MRAIHVWPRALFPYFLRITQMDSTPVKLVLNTIINRTSDLGERLYSYSVNGEATTITQANPITVLDLAAISTSETISIRTITQYQVIITAPFFYFV